jgi:hypothetical protein
VEADFSMAAVSPSERLRGILSKVYEKILAVVTKSLNYYV